MLTAPLPIFGPTPTSGDLPTSEARLRAAARDLEAAFLAEMLKPMDVAATPDGWGGGIGEEQVATLRTRQLAQVMADHGGVGLAESIFKALKAREAAGPHE